MSSKSLGHRIKDLREARGLSVDALAARSGVSKPYIWQIEDGRRGNPSGEVLLKLSSALGTTVAGLLGAEEGISAEELDELPEALKAFVESRGDDLDVRSVDVAMLRHLHYRGRRPGSVEDYELLFLFLRRILGD